jgi:hypothetical protein
MRKNINLLIIFFITTFSVTTFAQVPYEDRHSQLASDTWISTQKSVSPNSSRGLIHWLSYDLGDSYALQQSKFWNINMVDSLTVGAKDLIIDYSIDGTTWLEFGRYDLSKGNGSTMYEGEAGPNFNGLIARYVLINIMSNHGHSTQAGLAEFKVNVSPTTTDTKDGIVSSFSIKASPNPFADMTKIAIEGITKFDNLFYKISDVSGKTIFTKPLTNASIDLSAAQLNDGIYNFTIMHPSGAKSVQLIVVK